MKPWRAEHYRMAGLAMIVFVIDQWTKHLIVSNFELHQSLRLIPGFFNLTYILNTGAAWGLFRQHPGALKALAAVTVTVLLLFAPYFQGTRRWPRWGWALLVGGIAGNLADRFRIGCVVDFLDFYAGSTHWPAFNVADSAICAGVICYIIDSFAHKGEPKAAG
jgi:signal peptidase II